MVDQSRITTKGRYCLPGGEDVSCFAHVSAIDIIELRRVVYGSLPGSGVRIVCYLDNIGLIDGVVLHGAPNGFILQVIANPERRSRMEARLAWLRTAETRNDQRKAVRIVPVHRAVADQASGYGSGRSPRR